ncbi:MAG: type II secretion system protein [Candidatus Hydrogenedentes bacterium]|nr:type II secretion system protein [Candidatus Hydrogenedentota bacterium]
MAPRHPARAVSRRGFTLIELLTVIAIITLLAGITFTVLPRVREKARITAMVGTAKQMQTILVNYMTSSKSYPPMYGYVSLDARDIAAGDPIDLNYYFRRPYMALMKSHGQEDLYDNFSESGDTDRDEAISLLEFSPIGNKDIASGAVTFDESELYNGSNLGTERSRQLNAEKRPLTYIAVNASQAKAARRYWVETGDFLGTTWNRNDTNALRNITFPPPTLDAYVLISVGPSGSTFGLLGDPPTGNYDPQHIYYVAALRAYYLATRDLNDNGALDFEFQARTQQDEGATEYDVNGTPVNNDLPDPANAKNAGPLIFTSP